MLLIDAALRGKDNAKEIQTIDEYLIALMMPKNFDPEDARNVVINQERNFEKICAVLEDVGVTNPAKLSVYKFYSRIEYYKNKPTQKKGSDKENF